MHFTRLIGQEMEAHQDAVDRINKRLRAALPGNVVPRQDLLHAGDWPHHRRIWCSATCGPAGFIYFGEYAEGHELYGYGAHVVFDADFRVIQIRRGKTKRFKGVRFPQPADGCDLQALRAAIGLPVPPPAPPLRIVRGQ